MPKSRPFGTVKQIVGLIKTSGQGKILTILRTLMKDEDVNSYIADWENVNTDGKHAVTSKSILEYLAVCYLRETLLKPPAYMVDRREHRITREIMQKLGYEVVVLPCGDVEGPEVIVECKGDDFLSSVFSNDIYKQLIDAVNTGKKVYLVMYRPLDSYLKECPERGITDNVLIGIVAHLTLLGFPPIFCPNRLVAASVIDRLQKKAVEDRPRTIHNLVRERDRLAYKRDRKMFILTSFEGVGERGASALLDAHGRDLTKIIRLALESDSDALQAQFGGRYLLAIKRDLESKE